MPTNLPDQNWTVPAGPDPADAPVGFTDFAGDVLGNVILRYPDTATRDAFNGSRVAGDISFVIGRTWYDRWTGSKWLPCTQITAMKTGNQIVNNSTTMVDATGMVVPLPAANSYYKLTAMIRYTSNTTPDIKFGFTMPAGGNWAMGGPVLATSAAGQTSQSDWEGFNFPTPKPSGGAGGGTASVIVLHVIAQTTANTGNMQLQFAQNALEASNTTMLDFSCMTLDALQ